MSGEKRVSLFVFARCTRDKYSDTHDDVRFGARFAVKEQQI